MPRTLAIAALLASAAIAWPLHALEERQDITPVETISDIQDFATITPTPLPSPQAPSQDYKSV